MKSGKDFLSFYKKRARRLLPLYFISSLILMIYYFKRFGIFSFVDLLKMVTVTFPFFNNSFMPRYNPVLWSLGLEIWFSFLFPVLVIVLRKFGIYKGLLGVIVLSLGVRIVSVSLPIFDFGDLHLNTLRDSVLGRMDDFVLGMVIAHIYVRQDFYGRVMKRIWLVFLIGVLLVFKAAVLWDGVVLHDFPVLVIPIINNIMQAGLLLIILAVLYGKEKIINWVFGNRVIQLVGMMSYSLYVWHYIAIGKLVPEVTFVNIVIFLGAIFVFSFVSYRLIEFGNKNLREILPSKISG